MALYSNGVFIADVWTRFSPEHVREPLDHTLFTFAQWQASRGTNAADADGLVLEPGFDVATLAADLPKLRLIALNFPKYTDGRAFSMARQLRALGYHGEIRAIGNVLFDQLQLMARCGFDSFDISHAQTLHLLEGGRRPEVDLFYQPGFGLEVPAGARPWARKRAG